MNIITFRELQRMTAKEIEERLPLKVTISGKEKLFIYGTPSDSQNVIKKETQQKIIEETMTSKKELCSHGFERTWCNKKDCFYYASWR